MNKDRRRAIAAAAVKLDDIRALLEALKGDIENIHDEEQEYFDNMPESFQGGDKGQAAEAAVSALEDAISSLEAIDGEIDDAINSLSTAEE